MMEIRCPPCSRHAQGGGGCPIRSFTLWAMTNSLINQAKNGQENKKSRPAAGTFQLLELQRLQPDEELHAVANEALRLRGGSIDQGPHHLHETEDEEKAVRIERTVLMAETRAQGYQAGPSHLGTPTTTSFPPPPVV